MNAQGLRALFLVLALANAQGSTFTVTTLGDSGPGSLRQAIIDANASPGDDTITFATSGTITLASLLPTITESLTISGPGTNLVTISGNNAFRVFRTAVLTTNTISGCTIANGFATNYANGAGIGNDGTLTVSNCALINNTNNSGWGGALFNSSKLSLIDSLVAGNCANGENASDNGDYGSAGGGGAGAGGGVFTMLGLASIENCTFTDNCANGGNGGAFRNVGTGTGWGGGTNGGAVGGKLGQSPDGGNGGFGGGGGGGGNCGYGGPAGPGGGGGGGGYCNAPEPHGGAGLLGGGSGGSGGINWGGNGGGGAGIGGALLVHSGTVQIKNCSFLTNHISGGQPGTGDPRGVATAGSGIGAGVFIYSGSVSLLVSHFHEQSSPFFNYTGTITPALTAISLGGGTVSIDPPSPPYLSNGCAMVSALPAGGWTFLQWLGDATTNEPQATISVTRNKTVAAMFGTHLTCSSSISANPLSDQYPYGAIVKLTAMPPPGSYFISWTGDASGTNNPTFITVTNASPNVSCQFGTLGLGETSLTVIESGGGHVILAPPKYRYYISDFAGLLAQPDAGQYFLGWSGDTNGVQNPLVISMSQSETIIANFTKRPLIRVGTSLEGVSEDGFRLTVLGEFNTAYNILYSTNLIDWSTIQTVTNVYGTVQFTDPAAQLRPSGFYRTESY